MKRGQLSLSVQQMTILRQLLVSTHQAQTGLLVAKLTATHNSDPFTTELVELSEEEVEHLLDLLPAPTFLDPTAATATSSAAAATSATSSAATDPTAATATSATTDPTAAATTTTTATKTNSPAETRPPTEISPSTLSALRTNLNTFLQTLRGRTN